MIQQSHPRHISRQNITQKDTCCPMFTAALFPTAKIWEQAKCPSTDEWIKKLWYMCVCVYVHICIVAITEPLKKKKKTDEIIPFAATWRDPETIILSESKSERERQIPWYHSYVESKIWHNELIYETETDSQTERTDLWLREEGWAEEGCIGSLGLADVTTIYIYNR